MIQTWVFLIINFMCLSIILLGNHVPEMVLFFKIWNAISNNVLKVLSILLQFCENSIDMKQK